MPLLVSTWLILILKEPNFLRSLALFLRASGMTRSVMTGAANRGMKTNRDATGRVQVPLETFMTGTPSRTVRVSPARGNPKEAEGKLLARGTRIA